MENQIIEVLLYLNLPRVRENLPSIVFYTIYLKPTLLDQVVTTLVVPHSSRPIAK